MAVARGTLAVLGKGSKTRSVLVPDSLFEELSALALPDPDAPLFRSQKKGPDGGPLPMLVSLFSTDAPVSGRHGERNRRVACGSVM